MLALWLEVRLGKRNILELYLNRVYFGAGAYGVETASQRFFGKSAREVTLVEAAVLAGLLKAPSRYSPASNPQVARARAGDVLAKMVEARFLSAEESDKAGQATLRFAEALRPRTVGPRLCRRRRAGAAAAAGRLAGERHRRRDHHRRQPAAPRPGAGAERAVAARDRPPGQARPALVLVDLEGGIRAVVGGRSYAESQFNRALKAKRQPGSAFKMFVYLAALESGLKPDSTVLDLPILGAGWSPRNEGARLPRRRDACAMRSPNR